MLSRNNKYCCKIDIFFAYTIINMDIPAIFFGTIIVIMLVLSAFVGIGMQPAKKESFRVISHRPKDWSEINTGAPVDESYDNMVFEERGCSGAPGMEYLL